MYNANNRQSRFMSGAAIASSLIATGSKSFASQYNLLVGIQMFLDFFFIGGEVDSQHLKFTTKRLEHTPIEKIK